MAERGNIKSIIPLFRWRITLFLLKQRPDASKCVNYFGAVLKHALLNLFFVFFDPPLF